MILSRLITTVAALVAVCPTALPAADYRGMTSGWPVYANGYQAANYSANYGAAPAYYVARPTVTAGYATRPSGTMYMPVRAAYANPNYFAAYGTSTVAYRPVSASGAVAPAAAYYAPVTANYAPANAYAVTPAGSASAGSEAAAFYGQPANLNYVPPRFAYRTTYAQVPVYMYRPVTTYNPITAQPMTCLQPTTSSCCQTQRSRSWFSWLHPSSWFNRSSSCGRSCAPAPAPTTSYCGTAASQCGQPYYPVQPVVPMTPAVTLPPANVIPAVPSTTFPGTTFPGTYQGAPLPPAGSRIPPPPTGAAVPGTRIIPTPADAPPRLPAGSTTFPPGTTFPPPTGSFPSTTTPLPSGTALPPGSFPTNYPPATDPYSSPQLTPALNAPTGQTTSPNHSVFGSGYKSAGNATDRPLPAGQSNVIRAPDLGPAMPPSVQTVPDLDNTHRPRPTSNAPQLLKPTDKTATGSDPRWAVVPAIWPTSVSSTKNVSAVAQVSNTATTAKPSPAPAISTFHYDDRGWKSAR